MASTGVLFVCLGNICRSPLAEAVFRHLAEARRLSDRFHVDSAGTGAWHIGEAPDARSVEVAARHEVQLDGQARQIRDRDFHEFTWILAMDQDNLRTLERHLSASGGAATVTLLRTFDPVAKDGSRDVPDPYYGGEEGFERVYDMVARSCSALLDHLESASARGAGGAVIE